MAWSKVKRKVLSIEENRIAHEYAILPDKILIPLFGNAQEVLDTYKDQYHKTEWPIFIREYPTCSFEQKKSLFSKWPTLSVKTTIVKDSFVEPVKAPVSLAVDADL